MADNNPNETLISTLEQTLRTTRNHRQRLLVELREIEAEVERKRQDIEALDKLAEQTKAAIYGVLDTMQSGKESNAIRNLRIEDDYELPADLRRSQDQELPRARKYEDDSQFLLDYARSAPDGDSGRMRGGRNVPAVREQIEPVSQRFSDRTITQACTLILRETGEPMHVNELYNLLVAGGFGFTGNNPTISIAVSLNRNKRFRKVAPGTFDLVMREAPKTGS